MGGPDIHVDRHDHAEYVVVSITGTVDLRTSGLLQADLEPTLDSADSRNVVADLTGVQFLDSTGVTALVHVGNALREAGRTLTLVSAKGPVRRVLEVSGIDRVFAVVSTVEEATSR